MRVDTEKRATYSIQGYPSGADRTVLGMISGTSVDGIDVARVKFDSQHRVRLLSFETVPYSPEIKQKVLRAAADEMTLRETALLHTQLGELFAQVALQALGQEPCDLIASHGQTVCHLPHSATTLQLGEGSVIANRTGTLTVCDFRPADLALGGQGAPLVPLFDSYLLSHPDMVRVAVNLGGIANLSVLWPDGRVQAWDTGPANCVSDALCRGQGRGDFDPGGAWAASGRVDQRLLDEFLLLEYFRKAPPKSTGLEDFGAVFLDRFPSDLSLEDRLRTSLALSAQTLVDEILRATESIRRYEVVFAGGGTSNRTLMSEIEKRLVHGAARSGQEPPKIRSFQEFGIPEDAREAVAFAFLGDRTVRGLTGTVPSTTGARQAAVLGKVIFPSLPLQPRDLA